MARGGEDLLEGVVRGGEVHYPGKKGKALGFTGTREITKAAKKLAAINAQLRGIQDRYEDITEEALAHAKATGKGEVAIEAAKKRMEKYAAIQAHVAANLKEQIKDAAKLGSAVVKETERMMALSEKLNLSAEQTNKIWDRGITKQKELWGGAKAKLLGYATSLGSAYSVTKLYSTRIEEIRQGQNLLVASMAVTGDTAKETWKKGADYINAYREATRGANKIAAKFGTTSEELVKDMQQMGQLVAPVSNNMKDLTWNMRQGTFELHAYAEAMGGTFQEAFEDLAHGMRTQGKSFTESKKDIQRAIVSYDNLAKHVSAAARPSRQEFFAAIRAIRQELGPASMNMGAMTAAMTVLAESAKKAGGSAQTVKDTMASIPKVLEGMPQFFKNKVAGSIIYSKEAMDKLRKTAPEVATQIDAVMRQGLLPMQEQQATWNLLKGQPEALAGMMKTLSVTNKKVLWNMLQDLTGNTQQTLAWMEAIKGGKFELSKLQALMKKGEGLRAEEGAKLEKPMRDKIYDELSYLSGIDKEMIDAQEGIEGMKDIASRNLGIATASMLGISGILKILEAGGGGGGGALGGGISALGSAASAALGSIALPIALGVAGSVAAYYDLKSKYRDYEKKRSEGNEGLKKQLADYIIQMKGKYARGEISKEKLQSFMTQMQDVTKKEGGWAVSGKGEAGAYVADEVAKVSELIKKRETAGTKIQMSPLQQATKAPPPRSLPIDTLRPQGPQSQTTPGSAPGEAGGAGAGQSNKPAQTSWDPSTKRYTAVIDMSDPNLLQAMKFAQSLMPGGKSSRG